MDCAAYYAFDDLCMRGGAFAYGGGRADAFSLLLGGAVQKAKAPPRMRQRLNAE
jgi:hypothetical protein